jgi:hypothetical protein
MEALTIHLDTPTALVAEPLIKQVKRLGTRGKYHRNSLSACNADDLEIQGWGELSFIPPVRVLRILMGDLMILRQIIIENSFSTIYCYININGVWKHEWEYEYKRRLVGHHMIHAGWRRTFGEAREGGGGDLVICTDYIGFHKMIGNIKTRPMLFDRLIITRKDMTFMSNQPIVLGDLERGIQTHAQTLYRPRSKPGVPWVPRSK